MMYPISKERAKWVEARIFLLGRMINELTARQSRYATSQRHASYHGDVMATMISEQLQLQIEANCINNYLQEQEQAKANLIE